MMGQTQAGVEFLSRNSPLNKLSHTVLLLEKTSLQDIDVMHKGHLALDGMLHNLLSPPVLIHDELQNSHLDLVSDLSHPFDRFSLVRPNLYTSL